MLFQPELRASKLPCSTPRQLGNKASSSCTTAAPRSNSCSLQPRRVTPFPQAHTNQTAHQMNCSGSACSLLTTRSSHPLTITGTHTGDGERPQAPTRRCPGHSAVSPSSDSLKKEDRPSKYPSARQRRRDTQAFGQYGQAPQARHRPFTTGIRTCFHPQSCSDNKLSSTLPAQVQKYACVGAALLGKVQSLPCSTRISAQHAYVGRKERKTTRIRTELE